MSFQRARRTSPRAAMMVLCALLLSGGIVEFCNALWAPGADGIVNALAAGLLVVAAFAAVYLLVSLAPQWGPKRTVYQILLYCLLAAFGSLLFISWVEYWLTGIPANGDAMRVLAADPLQAGLHLLSTAPLLLALLIGLMLLMFTGIRMAVTLSGRAAPLLRPGTRLILCVLCVGTCALCVIRISEADGGGASYASLLELHPADADPDHTRYSCSLADVTPLVPASASSGNGRPIIVIVMESARADLMSDYRAAMPNLAALAPESVIFDRAYSTSTHTDLADLAFWYSRYPLRGHDRRGYPPRAPWRGLSAFEYFKLNGYATGYFSSQNEKWGQMINWLKIPAVDTYFDSENFSGETWYNRDDANDITAMIRAGVARSGKVEDSETLKRAAEWVDRHADEPFFVGLDLQNTHYHYYIPDGGAHPYQPDSLGFRAVYAAWPRDQAPVVRNRYLNAAWNMDAALGTFVQHLKSRGVWDRAVVLLVGDHGEAFYEHGVGNHSGSAYDEQARSLAMLKLPRGDSHAGSHFTAPVSHVDFMPTLVGLAGLQPWDGFQGISVWQRTQTAPLYLAVDSLVRQTSVVSWPWKLLASSFPAFSIELYNLEKDPGESTNLAAREQSVALHLLRNLREWETCQLSYYADADAHTSQQPPRFLMPPVLRPASRR